MTGARFTPKRLSLIGFVLVLLLAWFCYRPAVNGTFHFDDISNLSGLAAIEDTATAIEFVFTGTAGPTGRPLSLVTFALQAGSWTQGADAFLTVNILIHLFNAVLLAAVLYQLTLAQGAGRDRSAIVATAAAACWVLMPLLATSSLVVVQRMTTLSALFSLLGLAAYLLARRRLDSSPQLALTWMSASIVGGTVMATLAKETGLLLPVFVLVLEATVLQRSRSFPVRYWRIWQALFLALPTALVVAYLAMRFSYSEADIGRRGFTGWERLLTELPLLWLYLKKALVGLPSMLGIYQSPPVVSRSLFEPVVLLSAVAWLGLVAMATIKRRSWPLFGMAVLWYLGGHALESTTLPLELYFEHRNYLPVIGPVYAAIAALVLGGRVAQRAAMVVVPLYLAASAYMLYTFASISGDPSASARYWAIKYPSSVRAVTTLASYQLAEEGAIRALATLDRYVASHPHHSYLRIQELKLRCLVMPNADHDDVIGELRRTLPVAEFTYTAGRMLSDLFSTVIAHECNGVDVRTVDDLARSLYTNSLYAAVPGYRQFHHKLLAGIAQQQGQFDATIHNLEAAIEAQPSSELNMMMVTALGGAGNFDQARDYIDDSFSLAPRNPIWAWVWRRDLENLREYIDELERYSVNQDQGRPQAENE